MHVPMANNINIISNICCIKGPYFNFSHCFTNITAKAKASSYIIIHLNKAFFLTQL